MENTAGIIGVEGNGKLKINEYKGTDLYNHDNLTTTGGSIGVDFGKGGAKVNGVGVNNESHRKEGITRHTVIGNVEIGSTTGSPINRDRSKANETTKDTHRTTNINIESQTIEYATNPGKFKEDLGKAKDEIKDIGRAIKESLNDRGDDNRNFLGQLSEGRLQRTIENIGGERLRKSTTQEDISKTLKDTYKDLGYDINIVFTTPDKAPQLIDEKGNIKAGTAYVGADGKHTILINTEAKENQDRAGLIGTITEEGSHVIGKVEGRQRKVPEGSEEKGLESTGRATNDFFNKTYQEGNIQIQTKSDGKDYSKADFGEHVGDERGACRKNGRTLINCRENTERASNRKLTPKEQKINDRIVDMIIDYGVPYSKFRVIPEAIIGRNLITGEKVTLLDSALSVLGVSKSLTSTAMDGFEKLKTKTNKKPINKELHEKINNRKPGHYYEKQLEKRGKSIDKANLNEKVVSKETPKIKPKAIEAKQKGTKSSPKTEEKNNKQSDGNKNNFKEEQKRTGFEEKNKEKGFNDYASDDSDKNKRYTASESEAELTTRLKEMYKDKPNTTIETQESYKGGENVKYGIKGSVRPENSVVENGIVKETYEIKNYNQENYNSMTSNIGKQAIKRAEELPETATQKIVIDTRGQKITPEIRQKITEDIIRKSNKIIKKENIIFME